jgi:hypothetical protein
MPISENNRKRFEGIGFEVVRREVTVGNVFYLPFDPASQAEAKEWVAEREREIREAEIARIGREKQSLRYSRRTLVAAIAAVLVGIIGVVVTLKH